VVGKWWQIQCLDIDDSSITALVSSARRCLIERLLMILAQNNDANIGVGPITWELDDGEGGCSVQPSRDFGMYLQVKEILNEDWTWMV